MYFNTSGRDHSKIHGQQQQQGSYTSLKETAYVENILTVLMKKVKT
jgi:hypothetical protein